MGILPILQQSLYRSKYIHFQKTVRVDHFQLHSYRKWVHLNIKTCIINDSPRVNNSVTLLGMLNLEMIFLVTVIPES